MDELRIILDKSVVFGLHNDEVDSLDRFFFQIVPPILSKEILADLSKEAEVPTIANKIAAHSYRISGNRGITVNYRLILGNSLNGDFEIPMEDKYLPAGEKLYRTESGSFATKIETSLEDETIARWERKDFTPEEKWWAERWRKRKERPLSPKMYVDKITEAGLSFSPPKSDKELAETVESLLHERKLQGKLLYLISRENDGPLELQAKVIKRWFKEGRPMIKDFAPYAFFCLRANFLWALGLSNPNLFKPDKNDRKDLEYCYYLPHTEIFTSKDKKHKRLVPFLLEPYQSFVDAEELKKDLRRLTEWWNSLSREEKIRNNAEMGHAPPEDENSIVFRLWKKHRGEISKPIPKEILDIKLVDSRLPPEEQKEITFGELIRSKIKEMKASQEVSQDERNELKEIHGSDDPSMMGVRTTKISKARLLKLYPELTEADLEKAKEDEDD